jgi:hypothetical protein
MEEQSVMYSFEEQEGDTAITSRKSCVQKYLQRPEELEGTTYLSWLLRYGFKHKRLRKRSADRVLNFFPRYSPVEESEDFARVKLMLHHPFRTFENLMVVEHQACSSFQEAYQRCQQHHAGRHEKDTYGESNPDLDGAEEEDEFLSGPEDNGDEDAVFQELAARLPNRDGHEEDLNDLGNREIDRAACWLDRVGKYPDLSGEEKEFWKGMKEKYPSIPAVNSPATFDSLTEKQRLFFGLVMNHCTQSLNGQNPPQLLLHLDGQGGTGKSHVIMFLCQELDRLCAEREGSNIAILRAAPSGIAAYNIQGKTIHSYSASLQGRKSILSYHHRVELRCRQPSRT